MNSSANVHNQASIPRKLLDAASRGPMDRDFAELEASTKGTANMSAIDKYLISLYDQAQDNLDQPTKYALYLMREKLKILGIRRLIDLESKLRTVDKKGTKMVTENDFICATSGLGVDTHKLKNLFWFYDSDRKVRTRIL
jgi:hypothetical protein